MIRDSIVLFFNRTPLSLNVMLRMHWSKRKREQAIWDDNIYAYWMQLGRKIFLKPVEIEYTISFDINRQRDFDNYIGGTKFITDALRKTFLTRDDNEWLKNISVNFKKGQEGTLITIKEAVNDAEQVG